MRHIAKVRNYLDQTNTERLVHTFISFRLDHCNSLLYGLPEGDKVTQTTETTDLRSYASHKNTKTREHITESYPTVFTLATRLEQWIIFKLLLFTHKVVTSSLIPQYLSSLR